MKILKSQRILTDADLLIHKINEVSEQRIEIAKELVKNETLFHHVSTFKEIGHCSEVLLFILEPDEVTEYLKWKSQQRDK